MDSFENDLIASTALTRLFRELDVGTGSAESLRALGSAGKIEWDFLRSRVMDVITDWSRSLPELGLTPEEIHTRDDLKLKVLRLLQKCLKTGTPRIKTDADRIALFANRRATNDELQSILDELSFGLKSAQEHLRGTTAVSLHNLLATKDQLCKEHTDAYGAFGVALQDDCVSCMGVTLRVKQDPAFVWIHRRGQAEFELSLEKVADYIQTVEEFLQNLCDKYDPPTMTKSWNTFKPNK
jgi:hypothetical protein